MVRRLGIGATSASAIVFSVILISNLVVFSASQTRTTLYSQADAADLLSVEAAALGGVAATNLLAETQSIISAGTMDCSTAAAELSAQVAGLADLQRSGPLTVSASPVVVPGTDAADNLSIVLPYNGSVDGDLSLALRMSARTENSLAGVTFDRTVSHLVHLPVRWDSELSDCRGAAQAISSSVSATHVANCTAEVLGPVMETAAAGPSSAAAADGFVFGFSYSMSSQIPCAVNFTVVLEQPDVSGPGGLFSVRVAEERSATFA